MKYLKNPYFPFVILLLILSAFGYRSFFDVDYTETEKEIFSYNYYQNIDLKYENINSSHKIQRKIKDKFMEEGGEENQHSREIYKSLEEKMNSLTEIYESIQIKYFEEPKMKLEEKEPTPNSSQIVEKFPPKLPNPKIIVAVKEYIGKVSKLDSSIAKKYENYVFEEGVTNEELNDFYFDTDDYLRAFHYSRFEAQFAKMYYEDTELISQNYFFYPLDLKLKDAKVIPYVKYNFSHRKYSIETIMLFPFDKRKSSLVYPKNIETQFDKYGFIIIPKELRKGMQLFGVNIPLANRQDTTLRIKIDFKNRDDYYKDEK